MERVLLVDDDADLVEVNAEALRLGGYEVDMVLSAKDACDKIAANDYDVVVTDLQMPTADDGLVVLAAAKAKNAATKVVVISGKAEQALATRIRAAGADDFLAKPVWYDDLVAVVAKMLAP